MSISSNEGSPHLLSSFPRMKHLRSTTSLPKTVKISIVIILILSI